MIQAQSAPYVHVLYEKHKLPHFNSQQRRDRPGEPRYCMLSPGCNILHACYWAMYHQTPDAVRVCMLVMGEEAETL